VLKHKKGNDSEDKMIYVDPLIGSDSHGHVFVGVNWGRYGI